jgi:hypothetical protein
MRLSFDFTDALGGRVPGGDRHVIDDDDVGKRYRAIFISDLHLGTPGCQADALLGFMKAYPSDYLYLVGDIVDGWQLRRRWFWPQSHNDVVSLVINLVASTSSKMLSTSRQMAAVCGSRMVIILTESSSARSGWPIWVTTCMNLR